MRGLAVVGLLLLGCSSPASAQERPSLRPVAPTPPRKAKLPLMRSTWELTDAVDPQTDCTTRKIWGKELEICDLAPAFDRTFTACSKELQPDHRQLARAGCVINIAPGTFYLSRAIEICNSHVIKGAGGSSQGIATRILTPAGSSALLYPGYAKCKARGLSGAAGAELTHLGLESLGPSQGEPSYGVFVQSGVVIEHLWIRGYTQGIRINAGAKRKGEEQSNSNSWWIADVRIDRSGHAGLHLDGPDANAGLALRPALSANCLEASRWEPSLGPCANLYAGDFLGSTFVAAVASSAKDRKTDTGRPGYILGDSPNSHAVCVGCYAEIDQPHSLLAKNANAFGGITTWIGSGWYKGASAGGLSLLNDADPNNPVTITLGNIAGGGVIFRADAVAPDLVAEPLRLKMDPELSAYRFDVANLNTAVPLLIGASRKSALGLGGLSTPPLIPRPGKPRPLETSVTTPAP